MALTDEGTGSMVMPVAPMGYGGGWGGNYGYSMPVVPMMGGYGNGGFGFGGNDLSGLIVLFLFAELFGGFGNNGGGWGGFDSSFPWLLNGQAGINANTNAGFDNAAVGSQLNGIHNAITSGFASAEVAGCNRAIDALNRSFDSQTAIDNRLDTLAMTLQKCCCDNQLQTESLRATVLQENCADRYEAQGNARDIIANQTAGFQRILDKLCDQELFAERRENDQLRQQLNMANLAASQIAQTAQIRDGQQASVNALVNELRSCPIPAQPVYGSQPIFTCPNNNSGCGCGCGNNGFNGSF